MRGHASFGGWGETRRVRRANTPGAAEPAFDLRADLLDKTVVLHPRRARIDAGHAAEARVPVAHHLTVHADLAASSEIHQQDPSPGGIHLLAPEQIGRTGGEAEATVDAVRGPGRVRG